MAKKDVTFDDLYFSDKMARVTNCASQYGVAASVIDYGANSDLADGGYYAVAGLGEFPDLTAKGRTPKELEEQINRNDKLFYPKFFSQEITRENVDTVTAELALYCRRVEILNAMFREHECPIPDVMRFGEMTNLLSWNEKINNGQYSWTLRAEYEKFIDKFFQNEKKIQKDKGYKEFMDYLRSDRYDGTMFNPKKNLAYYKLKGQQEIPLELLQHTGVEIEETCVTEENYRDMKAILAYTPYVFYSVGDKEVYDQGRIEGPLDPWKNEKRYSEWRKLYYKKVDEPEVAGAFIRAEFVNMKTKDSIMCGTDEGYPLAERPVAKYVPYMSMKLFASQAAKNGIPFTFDYGGILLNPTFTRIPVVVERKDAPVLNSILSEIDKYGFRQHDVQENNLPYLDDQIRIAEIQTSAAIGSDLLPETVNALPLKLDRKYEKER